MKVRHTYKLSNGKERTSEFQILRRKDVPCEERFALTSDGWMLIGRDDWKDDEFAIVEKQVARLCGVEVGESFYVKFD